MSPFAEARITFAHDLRRRLLGPRGITLAALAIAGGTLTTLALVSVTRGQLAQAQAAGMPPQALALARRSVLGMFYGDPDLVTALEAAPLALVLLFWLSVWLAPAVVWLVGYDAIAGEVQGRTLRYFTPRVRRASLYAGKGASVWAAAAVMMLVTHAVVWTVSLAQGQYGLGDVVLWGGRFLVVVLAILAAWTGVAVLVSALADSGGGALLAVAGAFSFLFFVGFVLPRTSNVDGFTANALPYLYPNRYDALLLSGRPTAVLSGVAGCAAFAFGTGLAGTWLFGRRDV